jgi:hypothetical protein
MVHSPGPRGEMERPTAAQASSGRSARPPDARFDQRSGMRPTTASVHTLHSFGRKGDQVASARPSIGGRLLRTFTRFVVTILIGVGGTLAWQSYGDIAREMVVAQAPTLAWLLPPTRLPVLSASPNPAQQFAPAASSLDTVRRSVEQLAARQDQMAQSLAALLAIEADVRQKMSFTPPSAATLGQPAAPVQQYRPAQPRAR